MNKISRSLLIYWLAVLLLAGGLFSIYKQWNNNGRAEKKMKVIQASGDKLPWHYYLDVYGPKAVLLNCGMCVFLLAAGPWATRKLRAQAELDPSGPGRRTTVAVVAVTMVGCAIWASPRLTQSLWTDEATSMNKFMVGEYENEDGKLVFDPVEPKYRQFSMMTPNNHMLYSTIAGFTHQALAPEMKEPQDTYFKEWILRLPAFIAGLAALASLAWLAGELGLRKAGWLAVIFLALHPWHLQYLGQARGYSMIMALVPCFLAASFRAVRTGQWRWWLLSTLFQVAMINTWPLAADVVILGNLVILGLLLTGPWRGADRLTQIGRWAAVGALGAMASIQLLLPVIPQIELYMQKQAVFTFHVSQFITNPLSALFTGTGLTTLDPNNPYQFPWLPTLREHPIAVGLFGCMLLVLFLAGLRALWRHSLPSRWMAVLVVLIPVGITLHLILKKFIFLTWYGVPALPGVILTMGVGLASLVEKWRWGWWLGAPACLAAYALAVSPQHWALRSKPGGQNREAALITRKILNPEYPGYGDDSITAFVSAFYKGYDNLAIRLETVDELQSLMSRSDQEKRPLFVNLAREGLVDGTGLEILKMLRNPEIFDTLPPLYGTDPEATRWLFKYRNR